jgi:hypothetical protein
VPSPTQIIGAVVILWEGTAFFVLDEWIMQTNFWIMRKACIIWGCISMFIAGLAIIAFTIFPFAWELVTQSADVTGHSTFSSSYAALFRDIAVVVYVARKVWKRRGIEAVRKYLNDGRDLAEALIIAFVLTFLYHLVFSVPNRIRTEAASVSVPFNEAVKRIMPNLSPPQIHRGPFIPPDTPTWTKTSPEPTSVSKLFSQDFPNIFKMSTDTAILWKDTGTTLTLKRQEYLDFVANKKFFGFYIPSSSPPDPLRTFSACLIIAQQGMVQKAVDDFAKNVFWGIGRGGSAGLVFHGRVLLLL